MMFFVFDLCRRFKWMGNRTQELRDNGYDVIFAFEEAIGFCVGDVVKDKDGVCAAAVFSEFANYLEGIDLSRSMLDQAKVKNIYDELVHSDIIEYLSNQELNFDCFISTDVFIYIGDLSEVFNLIKSRNKKTAKLAFSTEHTNKDGFHIEMSGRYSHSKSYIEYLCEQFGYKIVHFSTANLRKEKGDFLTGGIYVLTF